MIQYTKFETSLMEKAPIVKPIFLSVLKILILVLNLPDLYSSYLAKFRRYLFNASKLHISNRKNLFNGFNSEDIVDNLHKQVNKEQSNFV